MHIHTHTCYFGTVFVGRGAAFSKQKPTDKIDAYMRKVIDKEQNSSLDFHLNMEEYTQN